MADDEHNTAQAEPASADNSIADSTAIPEDSPTLPPTQAHIPSPAPTDRTELLQRARNFLVSPQARHEDLSAKRRFLSEKGLTDPEIDGLLLEAPSPAPSLPPRTYPQPPPSRLPHLLLGAFRALTWLTAGSAALLLAYFRFLYPKIAQTYQARLSLRAHRSAHLDRLTHSLHDLKETQKATFTVLPQPQPLREPDKYADCHGLDQLLQASQGQNDIPPISLLRCAIAECAKLSRNATSAELFRTLEEQIPWVADEDAQYEETLWKTLTTTPLFHPAPSTSPAPSSIPSPDTVWAYTPPAAPPSPPLLSSLSSLKAALPPPASPSGSPLAPPSKFQHTFQSLADLTGYIATQTYALPHGFRAPSIGTMSLSTAASLSPEEEDVRREIRALKGLVLNRRTFMPLPPRPPRPGADGATATATPSALT